MSGPDDSSGSGGHYLAAATCAIYAAILALLGAWLHCVPDYGVETDFLARFVPAARAIQQGALPVDEFHGPIYPAVLALVESIVGDFMLAGQVVNSLSAAAIVFCSYLLFLGWFGPGLAGLGASLVALNPHIVQHAYTPCNDLLFAAFVIVGICFATRGGRGWWWAAVTIGCASLVRFNGLALLLALAIAAALAHGAKRGRARFAHAATVLGIGFLVFAPFGAWSWVTTGEFFHHAHHKNLAWTFLAQEQVGWEEFWDGDWCAANGIDSMGDVVRADPLGFAKGYVRNLTVNLRDAVPLVGWPIVALAAGGLMLVFRGKARGWLPLLSLGLTHFIAMGLVVSGPRFMLPLVVMWVALAMNGLSAVVTTRAKAVAIGIGCALMLVAGARTWAHNRATIAGGPPELREAAEAFTTLDLYQTNGTVLARKPHFAYLAGLRYLRMPFTGSVDEFLRAAEEGGVDYVYFGEIEQRLRPELLVLAVNPGAVIERLEVVLEHPIEGSPHPARLYRVLH